jgi:hypothetical protein
MPTKSDDVVAWSDIRDQPDAPTYAQLNWWTNSGRVKVQRGGEGIRPRDRRWPAAELPVILAAARLTRAGLTNLDKVFAIARGDQVIAPGIRVEVLPPEECTGIAATWCPVHGTCTCPEGTDGRLFDDPGCDLHGQASTHADQVP